MKTHRKLTLVAAALLAATFLLNHYYEQDPEQYAFNYGYVTGAMMLLAFVGSFYLFHKQGKEQDKK